MSGPKPVVSGRSVYNSSDGKTWILSGKTLDDKECCWRMKLDKNGEERMPFYANHANPKKKVWILPDVVTEEEGEHADTPPAGEPASIPPAPPIVLRMHAPTKIEAEGIYTLSPDTCEGQPVWITRQGSVLYSTSSGYWIAGTREAMRDNLGWVMSTDPHDNNPPNLVPSWSASSGSQWVPDNNIRCVTVDGSEITQKEKRTVGSSVYISEGDFWILEGKTLQDQPHVWKLKTAPDGSTYYVNPWNRTKVTLLPDVVGNPRAVQAVLINSSARSASVNSVGSVRSRAKSQLEADLETELEQHRRTIKCLEDKEVLYQRRESQLASDFAAVTPVGSEIAPPTDTQQQLDELERKLGVERDRLQQEASGPGALLPETAVTITTLERMHGNLDEQEKKLQAKAATLEEDSQQRIEQEKEALREHLREKQQQQQVEMAVKSTMEQHHSTEMNNIHERYSIESAAALEKHQEYLRQKAAELEHEHELETQKLQAAARQLEVLAKEKQVQPVDILNGAASRYARDLNEQEQDVAAKRKKFMAALPPQEAAGHNLETEQNKLQNEVNDFYLQTTRAMADAMHELEMKRSQARMHSQTHEALTEDELHAQAQAQALSQAHELLVAQTQARSQQNQALAPQAPSEASGFLTASALTPTPTHSVSPNPAAVPGMQAYMPASHQPDLKNDKDVLIEHLRRELEVKAQIQDNRDIMINQLRRELEAKTQMQGGNGGLMDNLYKQLEEEKMKTATLHAERDKEKRSWDEQRGQLDVQLSEKHNTLQKDMARQLQAVKTEFQTTLRNSAEEVKTVKAIASEMDAREEKKNELLLSMERKMADMQVEHEKEKSKLMKGLHDELNTVRKKVADAERKEEHARRDAQLAAEAAMRNTADHERLTKKTEDLKTEIVKMRMEISDAADAHNSYVKQLQEDQARETKALRDEIQSLREAATADIKTDNETLQTRHNIEKEGLLADHHRDVQAVKELMQREIALQNKQMEALVTELKEVRERHDAALMSVRDKGKQEREDLMAELRETNKKNTILTENLDMSQKAQRDLQVAMSTERVRGAQSDMLHGEEVARARQASHTPDTSGDVKQQLTSLLDSEFHKLSAAYIEPASDLQSRLKRFRDRSASRSASADPLPPYKYPSRSPSSSPYPAQRTPSSSAISKPDELRRLHFLKEQMRQRLTAEQGL